MSTLREQSDPRWAKASKRVRTPDYSYESSSLGKFARKRREPPTTRWGPGGRPDDDEDDDEEEEEDRTSSASNNVWFSTPLPLHTF